MSSRLARRFGALLVVGAALSGLGPAPSGAAPPHGLLVQSPSFPADAYPAYDLGRLGQPARVVGRDGGHSGLVGGRALWAFGDTILTAPASDGSPYRTNTGALDAPGFMPLTEPLDASGAPAQQLVPFTANEASFNAGATDGSRYAVWPTAVIEQSPGQALVFAHRGRQLADHSFATSTLGVGIADVTTGQTQGTRRANLLFGGEDCQWTSQMVGEDGYLYAYATLDVAGRDDCPKRDDFSYGVARVALADADVKSAYRFWNGTSWGTDQGATAQLFTSFGSSVYWNDALGQYLLVAGIGTSSEYRTAPTPRGPWSAAQPFVTGLAPVGGGLGNYAWVQHPELSAADGSVLLVSYLHPTGSATENRLVAVDLRSGAATALPAYVDEVYETFRGTPGDPTGRAYWSDRLEARTSSSGAVARAIATAEDSRRHAVQDAFQEVLGRAADATSETFWQSQVSLPSNGRSHLVAQLAASAEFTADHPTNSDFVSAVYPLALGRAADPGGLAYWTGRLGSGVSRYSVVRSLTGAAEAGRWQAGLAYQDILGRAATSGEKAQVGAVQTEALEIRIEVLRTAEAIGG